jgi:quinol---cytochrome c reductase iron-sulfur subunit, bacillus type
MNEQSNENEKQASAKELSRRNFLMKLSLGFAAASAAVAAIPVISALLAPLLEQPPEKWRKVGMLNDFPDGSTSLVTFMNADPKPYAGITAKSAAWLRKNGDNNFIAFAANCTHLGCPVRWEEKAHLFMCPCHGGVYYEDGTVAAGPPPKPLTHYEVRVYNDEVQIKTKPLPITNLAAG